MCLSLWFCHFIRDFSFWIFLKVDFTLYLNDLIFQKIHYVCPIWMYAAGSNKIFFLFVFSIFFYVKKISFTFNWLIVQLMFNLSLNYWKMMIFLSFYRQLEMTTSEKNRFQILTTQSVIGNAILNSKSLAYHTSKKDKQFIWIYSLLRGWNAIILTALQFYDNQYHK